MAFRGDISALILAVLDPAPLHGYHIARSLKEQGGAAKMTEGQIYPYLHKLEAVGLVTARWDTETGGAPRRIYQLTEAGVQELQKQRKIWKEFVSGVSILMNQGNALGAENA